MLQHDSVDMICEPVFNKELLQLSKSIDLKKKEVDDVLGGAESWKNAAKADGMYDTVLDVHCSVLFCAADAHQNSTQAVLPS